MGTWIGPRQLGQVVNAAVGGVLPQQRQVAGVKGVLVVWVADRAGLCGGMMAC